jgi:hypothetical protein
VPTERALTVSEPLIVPLPADLAGRLVKLTDPLGQSRTATATLRDGDVVAQWDQTTLAGFYKIEVPGESLTATLAVNVDPTEGDAQTLGGTDLTAALAGTGAKALDGKQNVYAAVQESRVGRELWYLLALGALAALVLEGVVARWQTRRNTDRAARREARRTPEAADDLAAVGAE